MITTNEIIELTQKDISRLTNEIEVIRGFIKRNGSTPNEVQKAACVNRLLKVKELNKFIDNNYDSMAKDLIQTEVK